AVVFLRAVVLAGTASAVHDTGLFQLDRNAQTSVESGSVPGRHDWDQVCRDATPNATNPTQLCKTSGPGGTDPGSANAAAVSFNTDAVCPVAPQCATANGNDASVFTGGGSKDFKDIQTD